MLSLFILSDFKYNLSYVLLNLSIHCLLKYTFRGLQSMKEALEGSPGIPLIILKTSHIPKINMANIPKIQKVLYPIPLKLIQVSHIPLNIYKIKFLANIPASLKTLPWPHEG